MKSKAVLKILSVILALGMLASYVPTSVTAATGTTQQIVTVEDVVLNEMSTNGVATYWVDFKNTADLSRAYSMDWSKRGWFVYETLKAQADKTQAAAVAYLNTTGLTYKSYWIANRILVKQSNNVVLSNLQQLPNVVAISAQKQYTLYEPETVVVPEKSKGIEPNLSQVKAPEAWALGFDGTGMIVANIDTGVRYSHQALVGSYRGNNGDGTFTHDYNWINPDTLSDNVPRDGHGHGTHTMGTMVGNDGGTNQIGIAPGAEWMACAGCPDGTCTDTALLGCGEFITAPTTINGLNPNPDMRPNVVNNSWGDCEREYDDWYADVIDGWHAAGIYPVFSNGNNSNCQYSAPPGLNTVGNPARSSNVTGVGSSGTSNGQYESHSNWGPTDNPDTINPVPGFENMKPQVIAPGVNIRSSTPGSDTQYQAGWTGTSMSAPHVTGLVAMIWQAAPCLIGDYATTETLLEETATPITYNDGSPLTPTDFPNFASGWGEINALAAVQMAAGMCGNSTLYGTVTSDSAEPVSGAKIVITGDDPSNNRTVYTNATGQYSASVDADTFDMTVTAFGYLDATAEDIEVADEASVLQDFVLTELPHALVTGTVSDDGLDGGDKHGYPLYAKLTFSMTGYSESVYTDPLTGVYEIVLYNGHEYDVKVEALLPGYENIITTITPPDVEIHTQDYLLNIVAEACSAPGYSREYDYLFDFEAGDHGFVSSGDNSSWSRGKPTNGPGAAHSGSYVIATNPNGNYNANELSYMTSPAINLTGLGTDTPIIEFWQWSHIEAVSWDNATVEVSKDGGTTWTAVLGPFGGTDDTAYNKVQIVLDHSYNVEDFMVRFTFKSDYADQYEGWYVDDIGIASFPIPASVEIFSQNFDTDDGGFVVSGANASWAWGAPSETPGPGAAYSPPNVWATNLTGNYNNNEESYITSPAIDLSSYTGKQPTLTFMHWYHSESNTWDYPSVEATNDGGTTWVVLGDKFGTSISPWSPKSLTLDPSYAVDDFQFRFHFHSDTMFNEYAGWYIDDVKILFSEPYTIDVQCEAIPGGLVAGYVYNADFPTEKLIGASVGTETTSALTAANTSDPNHAGMYYMFQAAETDPADVDFTISLANYETKVETREIEQDVVNHNNFELGTGTITANPTELEHTIWLHDDPDYTTINLINEGSGGANFKITESNKGFQPYSIPAFTGTLVESNKVASIFRDPNAAATVGSLELNPLSDRYGITAAPPAYGTDVVDELLYRWDDASLPGTSTLIGATAGATSLFAGDFMGSDFSTLYVVSYDNNNLYALDTETAEATLIGTTTPPSDMTFSGLAGGPGVMYGMATDCNAPSTLMEIDLATGATTSIGTLASATCIIDIAYVPDEGMLYGVDLVTSSLYRIDPTTGVDTLVGNLGAFPDYAQGMDYDEENNVLYWAAYTSGPELRIIDINTGASALIGTFTQGEVDSFAIAAGGGGGDVPWLDENPVEGYVPANSTFPVTIEFDVSDIEQPGDYFAELKITTDTPYTVPSIPVTLHVVRPLDYGNIKGNITATAKCDLDPAPFAKATINFYKNGALAYSTVTDETGYYSYALKNGTYDVEFEADGYVSQMVYDVVVGINSDTIANVQLRLDAPCLKASPSALEKWLLPDTTGTQTLTLTNYGAAEGVFELMELPASGKHETPGPTYLYRPEFDVPGIDMSKTAPLAKVTAPAYEPKDVLISEGFEDAFPPTNWEIVDFSPWTWERVNNNPHSGDYYTHVTYDENLDDQDEWLITPGFNLSEGTLEFWSYSSVYWCRDTYDNCDLNIWLVVGNVGGGDDILLGKADDDWVATWEWAKTTIDLTPHLPGGMVRIGFQYVGNDGADIAIDDITLDALEGGDIPWLSEDPVAEVVPAGESVEVTITYDATGLAVGDYNGILRVKNAPSPAISIPVTLHVMDQVPLLYIYLPLIIR